MVLAFVALYLASAVPFLLGRSLGSRQFQSFPSTIIWSMGIPLFFSSLLLLLLLITALRAKHPGDRGNPEAAA